MGIFVFIIYIQHAFNIKCFVTQHNSLEKKLNKGEPAAATSDFWPFSLIVTISTIYSIVFLRNTHAVQIRYRYACCTDIWRVNSVKNRALAFLILSGRSV